jgi:hypothetical protein
MTRERWPDPYDGRHPDRGDYRDEVDPIERAERIDAPAPGERVERRPDERH